MNDRNSQTRSAAAQTWLLRCGRLLSPLIVPTLLLGPAGCSGGAPTNEENTASTPASGTQARFDGVTLFKGFIFGQGDAAYLFPETVEALRAGALDSRFATEKMLPRLNAEIDALHGAGNEGAAARLEGIRQQITDGTLTEATLREEIGKVDPVLALQRASDQAVALISAKDATFFDHFADDMYSGDVVRVRDAMTRASTVLSSVRPDPSTLPVDADKCAAVVIAAFLIAAIVQWVWHWYDPIVVDSSNLGRDQLALRFVERLSK